MIQQKKRVVLYFPHFANPKFGYTAGREMLPLSVLSIAGIPEREGFEVVIIDGNLYSIEGAHRRLVEACEGALCYGTTSILGYQITDGLHATQRVKAAHPNLPTITGGWFPSVTPEMHLETGVFDAVCIGQGEITFAEFVRACAAGSSLEEVPGLAIRRDGQVAYTDHRMVVGWSEIPNFPWHLIDIAPYRDSQLAGRPPREMERPIVPPGHSDKPFFGVPYFASFGCPEPCGFCCSPGVTDRRWKAMPVDRLLDDLCDLHERWGFDCLRYFDANFGVSEKRIKELADGLIERGHTFWWHAMMQTNHIASYKSETLDAMRDSGMYSTQLGTETGDEDMMGIIGKKCPPDVNERAIRRLAERGISSLATYIVGFPDETEGGMMRTIDQCELMAAATPLCRAMVWPFRPIPGTGMYPRSVELGFKPPETLEEWGETAEYHLVGKDMWPGQLPPRVRQRRQVYEHFASMSLGLGQDRIGFWSRRAQRRIQHRDYRNGLLEARTYHALDRLTRGFRSKVVKNRTDQVSGYQTSILTEKVRNGERSGLN